MTPERKARFAEILDKRQASLTIILEDIIDQHNISAVLRSCDSVGIGEVYIITSDKLKYCKIRPETPLQSWKGRKISASANKWIHIHLFQSIEECMAAVRAKYDLIYSTHLSDDAKDLYELDLTQSVALLFGNERDGLSDEALSHADGNFCIPQVGMIKSLNISVACAVTLYEAYRQRNKAEMYDTMSLDAAEKQATLEAWVQRDFDAKRKGR
ncbi:MAG: TrmH family RNA methyltransferase [Chitinophagales bacterium]